MLTQHSSETALLDNQLPSPRHTPPADAHPDRFKKQRAKCEKEGPCDMGGWTRLLHSGQSDDLMDELPTMVVDPLPSEMVEHGWCAA